MTDGSPYIERPRPPRLTGDEHFFLGGEPLSGSDVKSFWRWAFSSLNDNTLRGDLMEWGVAHLLRMKLADRGDWTAYDLVDGTTTIQVKQSSYLQGWAQKAFSIPRFSGMHVSSWDPETNQFNEKGYQCDWYVFALLDCREASKWNPLDLDQWVFYLLPRQTLEKYQSRSVGIGTLDTWVGRGEAHLVTAAQLRDRGRAIMALTPGTALVVGREPDQSADSAGADHS